MICHQVTMPYRIMRCMSEAGVEVHVLGNQLSKGLKFSRFCRSFTLTNRQFDGSYSPEMAEEVDSVVKRLGVDLLFYGDPCAARSFHGIKEHVNATSFPGPSLEVFDLLNDKWEFAKICGDLDIPCPATRLYETKAALVDAIQNSDICPQGIFKPLSKAASVGVVKLEKGDRSAVLSKIDYEPILAQEYIEGEDIGASIYAKGGQIVSFIAHSLISGVYSTFKGLSIYESLAKLAANLKLTGVYNFDMRLTEDGQVFYLECNPRFFYKIDLAMIAGINFVTPGLNPVDCITPEFIEDSRTRTLRGLGATIFKPWKVTRKDWAFLRHQLRDPISLAREVAKIDKD